MEQYVEFMKIVKSDKTKSTCASYSWHLDNFIRDLNIISLEDLKNLTPKIIREYLMKLKETIQPSSVNGRLRILKAFFNWMILNEYMDNNPTDAIKKFKEEKKIMAILTEEESKKLVLACGKNLKLKLIVCFMLYGGLRREEVTKIKITDIEDCHLKISGKGRKERVIALHDGLCELLNEYLRKRDSDFEYLFYSRKSGPNKTGNIIHSLNPQSIYGAVKKAAKQAGIDEKKIKNISCHSLRRSFACSLARNGASAFMIQFALGHENVTTTQQYVRHASSDIADSALKNQDFPME